MFPVEIDDGVHSDSASLGSNPSPPANPKARIPGVLAISNLREIGTNGDGRRTKVGTVGAV